MQCDHFLLWLDAARRVGPAISSANLAPGLGALGNSYTASFVHADDFTGARPDGASEFRAGRFNSACAGSGTTGCYTTATAWRSG